MTDNKSKPVLKPEITIRQGAIAASIWKRQSPSGFQYYDFSLSRAWKAQTSGREGYSNNFFSDNQEQLGAVIADAASWIVDHQNDITPVNEEEPLV